ncbi:MAG: lauroyl acyltransferase, partial [Proteobacteria bacterium]|nr:lauroyl acyltransferase [Pseudomonadota bacterium]
MKKLRYWLEYLLLRLVFEGFRTLPLDVASCMGGWMARALGPWLRAHKIARQNLSEMMPELNERQRRFLLNEMWENLGRVAAELPHVPYATIHKRVQLEGAENLPVGKPVLFFSGHLGNWELLYAVPFQRGTAITLVYRRTNNPLVDDLVTAIRATQCTQLVAKGPKNAFKLMRAIKEKQSIALLIDQKMNDGIS